MPLAPLFIAITKYPLSMVRLNGSINVGSMTQAIAAVLAQSLEAAIRAPLPKWTLELY